MESGDWKFDEGFGEGEVKVGMGKMEVKAVLVGLVLEAAKDLAVKIVEVFNELDGGIEEAIVDCLEELHDGSSFDEIRRGWC